MLEFQAQLPYFDYLMHLYRMLSLLKDLYIVEKMVAVVRCWLELSKSMVHWKSTTAENLFKWPSSLQRLVMQISGLLFLFSKSSFFLASMVILFVHLQYIPSSGSSKRPHTNRSINWDPSSGSLALSIIGLKGSLLMSWIIALISLLSLVKRSRQRSSIIPLLRVVISCTKKIKIGQDESSSCPSRLGP